MKKIGMIGGVSWESTAVYYKLINEAVRDKLGGLTSAQLLIHSLNYQEIVDYENQDKWDQVSAILCGVSKQLQQSGADFVMLCCNTLHKIASDIEQSISVPFLHIADAAGHRLKKDKMKKIGLLGTKFTMEDGFYSARLQEKFQIDVILPEAAARNTIDSIIYKELCAGIFSEQSKVTLLQIIDELVERGAECVLLSCTELGILIKSDDCSSPILDTTVLHAQLASSLVI
jgi:aspartate racemase